jgi:hypothetical protein
MLTSSRSSECPQRESDGGSPISNDPGQPQRGAATLTMRGATALALVLAGGVVGATGAHAAGVPTAKISSTIYCYSRPVNGAGQVLYPNPSAAAQTKTGSGSELVTGTISGLTPGHQYVYLGAQGKLVNHDYGVLGTVAADGTVGFRRVYVQDSTGYAPNAFHAGTADKFTIYDKADVDRDPLSPPAVMHGSTSPVSVDTTCGTLKPGNVQTSLSTYHGEYVLTQQTDGNLVYRAGATVLWQSHTAGHAGAYTVMQPDGNLVVRSASGATLWYSRTNGHAGAYLALQQDRNLVIYYQSHALWQTHTA